MAQRLLNKVCLITGTGGSMGRAAALQFAQQGARIVGCDINTANNAETIKAVHELGGEIISLSPCDITKRQNCKGLVNLAISTYGRIDVLYNNAGMAYFGWMDKITDKQCALPAVAHVAAKGGVIAMTRQLAMEGREHGIRVNSISPGVIETLQTAPLMKDPDWSAIIMDKIMLGRFGTPDDVASAALFLASDESTYITATDIKVDGGLTAW
ncbi:SDR family NAD(P)-dependent oxidoreductase [Aspergillus stella-maris]|uniref:SDR family NAD(P)-dependent oxidoreductase n=1 Tax=Aspergillus stella-maris TaxID=1810926 RepID=UPI003CCE0EC5